MQGKLTLGIIGLVVAMAAPGAPAAAELVKGYPEAIICKTVDYRALVYLDRVNADGSAVYMALGGSAFATVTPDGVLHHEGAKDCDGKTLDQLEKDGQARSPK